MAVEVKIVLTEKQHAAFKTFLKQQFNRSLQERWFDDRYRFIPDQERTAAIIRSNPEIAAARKTLAALQNTPDTSSL